jgi:Ser/Thr protein kinase RdoA (MazF antagonist)
MCEVALPGRATSGLVRVGGTVRRPTGPWTSSVDALLRYLADAGFDGAPRPLGRDAAGRQVLEYVDGEVGPQAGTFADDELRSIGAFVRRLHEALAGFAPPAGARWQVVIPPEPAVAGDRTGIFHHDVAPWNLVRSTGGWRLIDWDAAAPGTRLWDLAYAAQTMAGLWTERTVEESAYRLRVFIDGYDPDGDLDSNQRDTLAAMLGRRARAMYDMLHVASVDGREPWTGIYATDGASWRRTADYLDAHADAWAAALR